MNISGRKNICANNISNKQRIGSLDVKTLTVSDVDIISEIWSISGSLSYTNTNVLL